MADIARNNLRSIDSFKQSVTAYEESVPSKDTSPIFYVKSVENIQVVLKKLSVAKTHDAVQMLRYLTDRIITCSGTGYSSYTLQILASLIPSKAADITIIQALQKLVKGKISPLTDDGITKISGIVAVQTFLKNYPTSDQGRLQQINSDDILRTNVSVSEKFSNEHSVVLSLGKENIELTLTSTEQQRVCFKLDESVNGSTIVTSIKVTPQIGEFYLDLTIRFTDTAYALINEMNCLGRQYILGSDTFIRVTDYFYSCVLDVISFDSGKTWIVGNIQILPPSLK
jgi:hypothetical protein